MSASQAPVAPFHALPQESADAVDVTASATLHARSGLEAEVSALRLLQDLSSTRVADESIEHLYEKVVEAAKSIMKSDFASLQMLDSPAPGEAPSLRLLAYRGFNVEAADHWAWVTPSSGCTCGMALSSQRRVVVPDLQNSPLMAGSEHVAMYLQTGIHAVQSTPLVSRRGELVGMISTHWPEPHEPSERDLQLLDILARQTADTLEQKKNHDEIRLHSSRQTFLLRLSDSLRQLADPLEIMKAATRVLGEHLSCDRAFYAEVATAGDTEYFVIENGYRSPSASELTGRFPVNSFSPKLMNLYREGRTLSSPDVETDPELSREEVTAYRSLGSRAYIGVPLVKHGRFSAVLGIHHAVPRPWTRDEILLVEETAERTWGALERARAEQERRTAVETSERQARLLDAVASTTPDFVYLFDPEGRFLYANRRLLDVWGLALPDVIGKTCFELGYEQWHHDMHMEEIAQVIRTREPIKGEVPFKAPLTGVFGVYEYIFTPVLAADGRVELIAGTTRDVTDRKRYEDELREAKDRVEKLVNERTADLRDKEELLRTVLNTLPVGVAVIQRDGNMSYLNPAFTEIWEGARYCSSPDEYHQYRMYRAGTRDPLSPDEYPSRVALRSGKTHRGLLFDIETFTGNRRSTRVAAAPLPKSSASEAGALVVVEDITEQQELQKQLLHVQKLDSLGSLAGGVAHDFNNLLMAIRGFTEVVYEEVEKEELRENLRQVLVAGERARELTHKLLTFSRQQVMESRIFSLSDAVRSVMTLLSRTVGENIDIKADLSPLPLPVQGSASQVEQVVMNIAINARDAMPMGGRLKIVTGKNSSVQYDGTGHCGSAFIAISDDGEGIPPENLGNIFDPYFTTKQMGKGTGLGLAIAYGIVQQHKGSIAVESVVGKGTTFKIFLPLADGEVPDAASSQAPSVPATAARVLVVEDDDAVRLFVKVVLQRAGYTVFAASGAEEALRIVLEEPSIDVVFTDVLMPKMNGIELFNCLKERLPDLKVIFASGYSSDIVKDTNDGRMKFLQKPVSTQLLLQAVHESLIP